MQVNTYIKKIDLQSKNAKVKSHIYKGPQRTLPPTQAIGQAEQLLIRIHTYTQT